MVNATVAITIRQQIGADSWLAVSGRDPRYWTSDNGDVTFAFRFGSIYGLPRWCEITYKRGSDDYTVHAYKIHRNGVRKTLSAPSDYEPDGREYTTYEGVYAERLPSLVRYINTIGELT